MEHQICLKFHRSTQTVVSMKNDELYPNPPLMNAWFLRAIFTVWPNGDVARHIIFEFISSKWMIVTNMAILKLTIFNTLSPNKVSTKFRPNISNATDNAYRSGGNLTKIHQIHELLYSSVPMNQRDSHSHSMVHICQSNFSHVCANRCCYFIF